jgi:hypothetical protein
MGRDIEELGLDPEEGLDLPRVVEEAHEVLGTYNLQLAGTGAGAIVAWGAVRYFGTELSPLWLAVALAVLLFLTFVPVTREPRLAKDVLRRWDALRVERALASSGVSSDPRLDVAEAMADRILRHPSADDRIRSATTAMVKRLRRLLDDLRRTVYLARAHQADERHDLGRSASDLQDLLDARVADVLSQLDRVVGAVEDLIGELEAEQEVERLLSNAEQE